MNNPSGITKERRLILARILIVDDEPSICTFLSDIVKKMNHLPLTAANGKEALDTFRKETIDLSIVDIKMPEMDGIEYLGRVKKLDPHAVVIIMTGYPSAETIIETIEEDGYTYIAKPLEVNRIMDLIERGLAFREGYFRD